MSNNLTEIESIVLGSFMLNDDNYWSVHDQISLSSFTSEDHQKIFAAITELATTRKAVKPPLVADRIGKLSSGQEAEVYLSAIMHKASKEEYIALDDYCDVMATHAKRRDLIKFADAMLKAAKDESQDPERLLDRAVQRVSDMQDKAARGSESTISSNLMSIAKKATSNKGGTISIRPCLYGLQDMIGDIPVGSLVMAGGGPGSGKTALAIQQAVYTGMELPTTLFQLEMSAEAMVSRAVQRYTGVRSREVMAGMTAAQIERMRQTGRDFEQHRLKIVTPNRMEMHQLYGQAYAHKRKHGTKLFIVDHLKLLGRHSKGRMDPIERAYENARDLKEMAKDLNAVVILLCQLTKAGRNKEVPEPEMEDFYGGSLEEHADIMLANFNKHMWLMKNPPQTNQAALKVKWEDDVYNSKGKLQVFKLKDRFGSPRDMREFVWDGSNTVMQDMPSEADQQALEV